jgi:peptide deformylase
MGVKRLALNWYARLSPSHGKTVPPYEHVVQIGDPRLRKVCEEVPVDKIKTNEIQEIIKKLRSVIHKYGSVGMSAPQIGVNMKIMAIQHTAKQISAEPSQLMKFRGVTEIPFTVSKYKPYYEQK